MRWHCAIFVLGACLCCNANAQEKEYYLNASTMDASASILINGFPVHGVTNSTLSSSQYATIFMHNGMNTVSIRYAPSPHAEEDSHLEIVMGAAMPGKTLSSGMAESLLDLRIGAKETSIGETDPASIRVLAGIINPKDKVLEFSQNGKKAIWAGRLLKGGGFAVLPSALSYTGLNHPLKNVQVHFWKSECLSRVVFDVGDVTQQFGAIALPADRISHGRESACDGPFDCMLIQGECGDAGQVRMVSLVVKEVPGNIRLDRTVQADVKSRWSWEDGDKLKSLDAQSEESLRKQVMAIYAALEKKDASGAAKAFAPKVSDMAKIMGKDVAEMQQAQEKFFKEAMEMPGWGMRTLRAEDIAWTRINERVIKVHALDGNDVLVSNEIKNPAMGGPSKLTIPLYMSRIGGQWWVVR